MKYKEQLSRLSSDFFKAPTKIFRMGLSANAISVYCLMASCSPGFDPSLRILSKKLRISPKTASNAILELLEKNVIRTEFRQAGLRSAYSFVHPRDWAEHK